MTTLCATIYLPWPLLLLSWAASCVLTVVVLWALVKWRV